MFMGILMLFKSVVNFLHINTFACLCLQNHVTIFVEADNFCSGMSEIKVHRSVG